MTGQMRWQKSVDINPAKLKMTGRSISVKKGFPNRLSVTPASLAFVRSYVTGVMSNPALVVQLRITPSGVQLVATNKNTPFTIGIIPAVSTMSTFTINGVQTAYVPTAKMSVALAPTTSVKA